MKLLHVDSSILGDHSVSRKISAAAVAALRAASPGLTVTYGVTPNKIGRYPIVCAELCGLGHATMRAKARVVTEAEFDKWIEEQRA